MSRTSLLAMTRPILALSWAVSAMNCGGEQGPPPPAADPGPRPEEVNALARQRGELSGELFEGDIVLSPAQRLADPVGPRGVVARPVRGAYVWSNGVIPYTIDPALTNQQRVRDAIAHWERMTPVRLVPRSSQADYVTFRPGSGCSSSVGRVGGQQFIDLASGCGVGATIHEIGHAAGVWHQQSSVVRDRYVTIHWDNIQTGQEHNFRRVDEMGVTGWDLGSYDYFSVMHYGPTAFAKDTSKPTVTRTDGSWNLGSTGALSSGDVRGIEQIYGAFAFSSDGAIAGRTCTAIREPAEPGEHTWNDNFLCAQRPAGLIWRYDGPAPGMRCTQVNEPSDPHTWSDNYLCAPNGSPFTFNWYYDGPRPGQKCVQFWETEDPHAWDDNYLCYEDRRAVWSYAGPIPGRVCTRIEEPAEPGEHGWGDNYLCTDQDYGLRWSYSGPIDGMLCTQWLEGADPHTWTDNYLCVPPSSPLRFSWSNSGPIPDRYCVQLNEPSDPHTWGDNYLCF